MEEILKIMIEQMKKVFGENLKSVILYGSKASGEDTKKHSDYNVLLILDAVNFGHLKNLLPITAAWLKAGNPPPFLFSMQMFKDSADVFPIEFLDMKDHHKIFYGEDPLTRMEIDSKNLRHQCEFELKGKLLNIRQRYLLARGKPDKVKEILMNSISPVLVVFRHVVRLFGQVPPDKKMEALDVLSNHIGFSPEVFVIIVRMKQGERVVGKADIEKIMAEYVTQIEKVVNFVDSSKGGKL